MKKMIKYLLLIFILHLAGAHAQKTSIEFELNGRNDNNTTKNPFKKFMGECTLKDNNWTQNWGNGTETIKIPNHHTLSGELIPIIPCYRL